jgi:two-component system response regulator LytT
MKITYHIIFWVSISLLLVLVFGEVYQSYVLSFYFVTMLLPVAIATAYVFNYFLVPHYLIKRRYLRFALYVTYLFIGSSYLEMWVMTGSLVLLADLNYSALSPVVTNVFILAIIIYFVVFLQAFVLLIRRTFQKDRQHQALKAEKAQYDRGFLTVWADRKKVNLPFDEISYLESMGDYVKITLDSTDTVITRERIKHLEQLLPDQFLRIHRSYIINRHKIEQFSKSEVLLNDQTLPISRTYKQRVYQKLSS